jgi:hypothetical protein
MALRFRDWTRLDATERARLSATTGDFARQLEPRLKAFVAFESEKITPARGVLDGMPYAVPSVSASRYDERHALGSKN